jgi:hypothetical protein
MIRAEGTANQFGGFYRRKTPTSSPTELILGFFQDVPLVTVSNVSGVGHNSKFPSIAVKEY